MNYLVVRLGTVTNDNSTDDILLLSIIIRCLRNNRFVNNELDISRLFPHRQMTNWPTAQKNSHFYFIFFFLSTFRSVSLFSLSLSFLVILWFVFETLDACTHTHTEREKRLGTPAKNRRGGKVLNWKERRMKRKDKNKENEKRMEKKGKKNIYISYPILYPILYIRERWVPLASPVQSFVYGDDTWVSLSPHFAYTIQR